MGEEPRVEGPCEVTKEAEEEDKNDVRPRGEGTQSGWIRIGRYDSARRRALWVRFNGLDDEAYPTECDSIELCAGREGDDSHVKIRKDAPGMKAIFRDLEECLLRAADHIPARWYAFDAKQKEKENTCKRCGKPKQPFQVYCGAACSAQAEAKR